MPRVLGRRGARADQAHAPDRRHQGQPLIAPSFPALRARASTWKRAAIRGRCSSCRGTTCCSSALRTSASTATRAPLRSTTASSRISCGRPSACSRPPPGSRSACSTRTRAAAAAVSAAGAEGAITRRHLIRRHRAAPWSVFDRRRQAHDASRARGGRAQSALVRICRSGARAPRRASVLCRGARRRRSRRTARRIGVARRGRRPRAVARLRRRAAASRGSLRDERDLRAPLARRKRGARRGAGVRVHNGMGRRRSTTSCSGAAWRVWSRTSVSRLRGTRRRSGLHGSACGTRRARRRSLRTIDPACGAAARDARAGSGTLDGVGYAGVVCSRSESEVLLAGLLLDRLEAHRRAVAAARVQVLARHVGERAVAFLARAVPVMLLPALPSSRAKVSVGGRLTRIPYGFGTSSDSFKLCAWQMSIERVTVREAVGGRGGHISASAALVQPFVTRRACRCGSGRVTLQSHRMSKVVQAAEFFVVGGPVQPDRPCYVERAADRALEAAIHARESCCVIGARAIGKTSLMTRVARTLRQDGGLTAIVDLAQLGARGVDADAEQWIYGIAHRVVHDLHVAIDLSGLVARANGARARRSPRGFLLAGGAHQHDGPRDRLHRRDRASVVSCRSAASCSPRSKHAMRGARARPTMADSASCCSALPRASSSARRRCA